MKKLVAVLLMLCMACLSVPAMADVSIEGVWKLDRVVAGDQQQPVEQVGDRDSLPG